VAARYARVTDTIKLAAKDMKAFVITFFIYFFAFCQLAYLLFGTCSVPVVPAATQV